MLYRETQNLLTSITTMVDHAHIKETAQKYKDKLLIQYQQVKSKSIKGQEINFPYSMFENSAANCGPSKFQTYLGESSDSESAVWNDDVTISIPTLERVIQTIKLQSLQQVVPTTNILQGPTSLIIIQNINITVQISVLRDFLNTLPIKGFVVDINPIYYCSHPCLIIKLKTNQPQLVAAYFHNKTYQKSLRQVLGCDFKAYQLTPEKVQRQTFYAIVMRGVDFRITSQMLCDLIEIILEQPPSECIIESSTEVLDVLGVGCAIVVLKTLEQCERIILAYHQTTLNDLQATEVLLKRQICIHSRQKQEEKIKMSQYSLGCYIFNQKQKEMSKNHQATQVD